MSKVISILLTSFVSMVIVVLMVVSTTSQAQQVDTNAQLEQRLSHLASELRCLVCQNQTLADSNAQLALDLKKELREKLAAGVTDQQAIDFMVQRYGDFVLYKPRLQPTTWLLWFGPFILLLGGLALLLFKIRRQEDVPEALAVVAEVAPDRVAPDRVAPDRVAP